jgi:hypothetical protein
VIGFTQKHLLGIVLGIAAFELYRRRQASS